MAAAVPAIDLDPVSYVTSEDIEVLSMIILLEARDRTPNCLKVMKMCGIVRPERVWPNLQRLRAAGLIDYERTGTRGRPAPIRSLVTPVDFGESVDQGAVLPHTARPDELWDLLGEFEKQPRRGPGRPPKTERVVSRRRRNA